MKPWLRLEVYGEGVWLAVDDVFELTLHDSETGPSKSWRPVLANTLLFDEEFGGYLPQLEHFLQVVRGEEAASITGQDGYKALELVVATHLAIGRSPWCHSRSTRGRRALNLPLCVLDGEIVLTVRQSWEAALRLSEARQVIQVKRPEPDRTARRLAACVNVDDVRLLAKRRLPRPCSILSTGEPTTR